MICDKLFLRRSGFIHQPVEAEHSVMLSAKDTLLELLFECLCLAVLHASFPGQLPMSLDYVFLQLLRKLHIC